jgi:hypothetical protein
MSTTPSSQAENLRGHLERVWTCGEGERSAEVAEVWLSRHAEADRSK